MEPRLTFADASRVYTEGRSRRLMTRNATTVYARCALLAASMVMTASCAGSHARSDAGGDADAGRDAYAGDDGGAARVDAAAACTVLGDYSVPPSHFGFTARFRFRPDGTWGSPAPGSDFDTAGVWGTYEVDGARFLITGEPCEVESEGRYEISYEAACRQFLLRALSETCPAREAFDGAIFTRL